jgi:hypothetical protein
MLAVMRARYPGSAAVSVAARLIRARDGGAVAVLV